MWATISGSLGHPSNVGSPADLRGSPRISGADLRDTHQMSIFLELQNCPGLRVVRLLAVPVYAACSFVGCPGLRVVPVYAGLRSFVGCPGLRGLRLPGLRGPGLRGLRLICFVALVYPDTS